jgi:RimJ/RimL family protein N-acetyltransferase
VPRRWGTRLAGYLAPVELLRTKRLLLRRWTRADAPAFLAIYGRDDVTKWLGPHPRRPVADLAEAEQRLDRWHEREAGLPLPFGLWAVVEFEVSATPVGTVLLLPLRDATGVTSEVEVGWHLRPDHQGRGLATEASQALLVQAAEAGLSRVLALTDPDNTPSQAVARRLGMVDEGITDRWFGITARQFAVELPTSD